jgi:hypothetical protein
LVAALGVASALAALWVWAAVVLGKRSDEAREAALARRAALEEEEEGLVPPPT